MVADAITEPFAHGDVTAASGSSPRLAHCIGENGANLKIMLRLATATFTNPKRRSGGDSPYLLLDGEGFRHAAEQTEASKRCRIEFRVNAPSCHQRLNLRGKAQSLSII